MKCLAPYKNYFLPVLLLFFLFSGIMVFRDYGISWDENTQRNSGIVFLNHIQKTLNVELVGLPGNIPNLEEYQDKEFGAAFEVFLFMAERLFHLKDYREVFLFRHLVNFIFFWIGVLVFSAVIRDRYRDWFFPLIGSLMLFLHPRIFAESFYNSKDIILMVFFTFSMWSYIRVLKTGRLSYILLLAFISAITFNIRPIGILIPCLAFIILPTHFIIAPESPAGRNRILKNLIALPLFFLIFSWITNPYLWIDPIGRAGAILVKFLNYDVSHTAGHLLFLGKFIPTSQIPWFYLPLWIGITTPIVYLVLSISGLLVTITKAFRNKSPVPGLPHHSLDVYVAGWLIVPAFTAILFGSTLYDGWRHFYFLWPAIVYFAISGLQSIIAVLVKVRGTRNTQAGKWIVLLLAAIVLSENLYTMIRYHPHQYCYFNEIAPDPSKNFELDYWGLSYHDALEHLVTTCPSDTLSIRVLNLPGYLNAFLLKPADRKRVWFDYSLRENYSIRIDSYFPFPSKPNESQPGTKPSFYLSNFRDTGSPDEMVKYRNHKYPYTHQIYSLKCCQMEIMGIYKLE